MKDLLVAKRYAKALYEVAVEAKEVDGVQQGLSNICLALESSLDMAKVFFNPLLRAEDKENLVKKITSNKLVVRFVGLLAVRKRLKFLPAIYEEFREMADQARGIHKVVIKTAKFLSEDQKRDVEKSLAHWIGGKIIGNFSVSPDLIGGVWVKVGDNVLDATVKGRFDSLKQHLAHSTN